MKLINTRGILLSLAITLAGTPTAWGMTLDTVGGTVFEETDATVISNLGDQIGSISYGDPIEGSLGDSNDAFTNTGTAYDLYGFSVEESGLPYVITASSSSFVIAVTLYHYDAEQNVLTPLQVIVSLQSNGQVQFSGIFTQTGRYLIQIVTGDANSGAYNLRLDQEIPFSELGGDDSDPFGGNDDFGNDDFGNDDFGNDDFGNDDFGNDDFGDQNGENFDDEDFFGEGNDSDF